VYQSVMNYLQLPAGAGKEEYFEFDLKDFVQKFNLDIQLVIHALSVLQQEEIISLNEQVFLPPTVQFTCSKNDLFEFEKTNPLLDALIKSLLRTYEGILDFPTFINERFLANLSKTDETELKKQLAFLDKAAIIEYVPQKEKPQIYCYHPRVRAEDLQLNLSNLEKRKRAYKERVAVMIAFTQDNLSCRSKFIADYFGDKQLKRCGICDNCLNQKSVSLNETEFVDIHMRLLKLLQKPLHAKEVMSHLTGIRREKAWKVIDHLQAENKIEVDGDGWIRKLKG